MRRRVQEGDCPYCSATPRDLRGHIETEHPVHADRRSHGVGYSVPIDPKDARPHLVALYGRHCQACGRRPPEVRLTTDHVVPYALGGLDRLENYQLLCEDCNQMKGAEVIDFRLTGEIPTDPGLANHGYEGHVNERPSVEPSADGPAAPAAPDDEPNWLTFSDIEPPESPALGEPINARLIRYEDGSVYLYLDPVEIHTHNARFRSLPDGETRLKLKADIRVTRWIADRVLVADEAS